MQLEREKQTPLKKEGKSMRAKHYSVLMIGLLALGLLILNHALPWEPPEARAAGEPIILFVAPTDTPRYVDDGDPIDPEIVIGVEVDFPDASTPCAGAPLPVDHTTLVVKVHRQLDGARLETWDDIDESTWTWDASFKNVTGQVTIGGAGSGQDRSLYGIEVCISNGSAQGCATKGIRVEHPVSEYVGGSYLSKASSFSQNPGCGLVAEGLLGIINGMMNDTEFGAIVPNATAISAGPPNNIVQFPGIPLLGSMSMNASLNAGTNNIDLAPVTVTGVDLGAINAPLPPGYNCEISGSGDGFLLGEVSPGADLDGEIRVYDITLGPGSGTGECTRDATGCELVIKFDGNLP
jgi:hypothetical protein